MNEWRECKLGEVAERITSGGTPSTKVREYYNGNIPWLNTKEINFNRLYSTDQLISEKGLDNSSAKWIEENSVIVAMYGATAGKIAINKIPLTTNQACCNITLNSTTADYNYIFYYLMNKYQELTILASGAAQQNLNAGMIADLDISLPPLPEQKAIAGVLSSLDDKIDLLHSQNKTLEAMAETLWRKMFIEDADPNWKKGKLGDLIELCYGKGLKENDRIPGKYPVVGSNGAVGFHNDFLVKGPGIVIGRKGTLGEVNYIEEDFFPIDTTFFIKSKTNSGKLFYEYFLLKEFSFEEMNSDSAVPGLNRDVAESTEMLVPDKLRICDFNEACGPFYAKKRNNQEQFSSLSKTRDALLPKLMSGEVRVDQ